MRINKYLAHEQYCTRREADELIQARKVLINGVPAQLGDKVYQSDKVEVRFRPRKYRYFAYHKPRGVITHSPQEGEESIADISPVPGVFPIGRLDKDSYGLIILTDDGRITDALLNPDREHEKEYEVTTRDALTPSFKTRMEHGVDIGGYVTKPCHVELVGSRKFSITLTEGKKHQIRRMCGAFGHSATQLKRVRIMNVAIGNMRPNEVRPLEGAELKTFLTSLGIKA
jgi:23S rRNA pseudouridine2604 synthase